MLSERQIVNQKETKKKLSRRSKNEISLELTNNTRYQHEDKFAFGDEKLRQKISQTMEWNDIFCLKMSFKD